MKFHFSGQILSENGELKINIPFNVWEVCDSRGCPYDLRQCHGAFLGM